MPAGHSFSTALISLCLIAGSRNVKPDALSRQLTECPDETVEASNIVPASCLVASVTWEIEEKVRAATLNQPIPQLLSP